MSRRIQSGMAMTGATMKLLPYDSYVLETQCTVPELVARLATHVEAERFVGRRRRRVEFVGRIGNGEFQIKPVVGAQSSFLPEIFGRFEPGPIGARVYVEMIPSVAVLTILAVLSGILGMAIFYNGPQVFVLVGSNLLLVWFFAVAGFWLENGTSRRRLAKLLCGEVRPLAPLDWPV